MTRRDITIVGAGVLGVWQALRLAQAGHRVRLIEESTAPFAASASRWAGAMIAPECEAEAAPLLVRDLGRGSLALWRSVMPDIAQNGTLLVAQPRDQSELSRFARDTQRHQMLDETALAALEPDLAGRFSSALFYPSEAHMDAIAAMTHVLDAARKAGAEIVLGQTFPFSPGRDGAHPFPLSPRGEGQGEGAVKREGAVNVTEAGIIIDCRGLAARTALPKLRGVRGERLMVRTNEVKLARPVRLIHPRQPIYVVPQGDGRFVIGATVIEREDDEPMTIRSALELLGSAYALHPAFGEASILDAGAGVRPAYPDNVPRALIRNGGKIIHVNGAYRHGFLLAPVLADAVTAFIAHGAAHPLILREG
jgi:glycine oxidase